MMHRLLLVPFMLLSLAGAAQYRSTLTKESWVDSVYRSLTPDQRIAQLIVVRAHSNLGPDHVRGVEALIRDHNVGALCFFQGGPVRQALLTNRYQEMAKTPLMITIDGEWGLGMRLDSVDKYPFQLTLGALTEDALVREMGRAVGRQMHRIGVHVNYAPVVDINNNPGNPVIGYRSFGEDKFKVGRFGAAYVRGMQEEGIMACAKHFPGHGDTEVDSHHDLPVISKSIPALDSLELYPFKQLFSAGVGSVMIAHLSIPSIDNTANLPTSLSKNNVDKLLRDDLGFDGLSFTDALEMKGVTKFFPAGEAAVQALLAGNDMLCLPEDVPAALKAINAAVSKKRLKQKDIEDRVRRVLAAKYDLGLNREQRVVIEGLTEDLNRDTDEIKRRVARSAVTVLRSEGSVFPFTSGRKTAYVGLGLTGLNAFGRRLVADGGATPFLLGWKEDAEKADSILRAVKEGGFDAVIIGVHNYSFRPASNYGISAAALGLWNKLQADNAATFLFGNVYAAKNFCSARNLVAVHQDDDAFGDAAADFMRGAFPAKGQLPVTVCSFPYGTGVAVNNLVPTGFAPAFLKVDSIMQDAIRRKAFPGGVVLAAKDGKIVYHKAFGHYEYGAASLPVRLESIYDLASVTKISATTVAIMKLYEEGRVDLDKTIGDYLPWVQGTDKSNLTVRSILLHQAGLVPFIPFYKETINAQGVPDPLLYRNGRDTLYNIPVARNLYLRRDWQDTLYQRILRSPLSAQGRYVYSDNDFIFLGKIVEAVTGRTLDQYVEHTFYRPMGMTTTGFRAGERFGLERVVPTEAEPHFRRQLLQGYVHDEGASLFGGVAGHAGLFSNAFDLSQLYQMLLNGGTLNGRQYLSPQTIELFTAYGSDVSRRALGFDKPEKDNDTRPEPYPARLVSPRTFGHTGFTGTAVWADPQEQLVFIFLSNRVYPTRDNPLLTRLNVRGSVLDALYEAVKAKPALEVAASE